VTPVLHRCMDSRHVHYFSSENAFFTLCGLDCAEFDLTNKNVTCKTCKDVSEHQEFERGLMRERYGVSVAELIG
jgi:hypothetical protein